ncbi:hypothetical protein J1N35_025696, partial [Gossypium stocksii]
PPTIALSSSSLYSFFTIISLTLSKAAMSKRMSYFVLVVYSNALASLILLPTAFFFTRFSSIYQSNPCTRN